MVTSFRDMMNQLSEEERQEVHRQADEIRTELALREIRWTTGTTQQTVARKLKINQSSVSKLESRTDMNISTLEEYVKALGGELELYVKLPNKKRIKIKRAEAKASPTKPTQENNAEQPAPRQVASVARGTPAAKKSPRNGSI